MHKQNILKIHIAILMILSFYNTVFSAATSKDEFIALDKAIKTEDLPKIKAYDRTTLLELKDDAKNNLLHRAASYNKLEIGEYFISIGSIGFIDQVNKKGYTPLDVAVLGNRVKFAQLLINAGADKNKALYTAVEVDNPKAVQLLLSLGADINTTVLDGYTTPYEQAVTCKSKKVILFLNRMK